MAIKFLKVSRGLLVGLPKEVAAGLWRMLLILLLALLLLLRLLWGLFGRLFGRDKREEPVDPNRCCEVPVHVKRKPDPCLYSQPYLMAQGLSVTWDNPDIWLTLPDGTPVSSSALQPGTAYVVHARILDASFDPAIATEVRCFYRPWSFNSPDRTPIEFNPNGTEKVVVLHIPPWSSEVAEFNWTTPNIPNRHWCLQVECRHADDKNPNNNLGQENTQVLAGTAGQAMAAHAVLHNPTARQLRAALHVDHYSIPDRQVELTLATRTRYLRKAGPFDGVHQLMLTRDSVSGKLANQAHRGPSFNTYAYRGFDQLIPDNGRGHQPLDPTWQVTINGEVISHGHIPEIGLAPDQTINIPISLTIPAEPPGTRVPLNVVAVSDRGKLLGGVTMIVEVI